MRQDQCASSDPERSWTQKKKPVVMSKFYRGNVRDLLTHTLMSTI